jgi:prevent-host-death family protein
MMDVVTLVTTFCKSHPMREATIREAKSKLTSLIQEAEKGKAVRLTRRGKAVAVIVSDREYERLAGGNKPARDFMHFLQGWRREMIAKGLPFVSDEEVAATRDKTPGRGFSFEE